MTFTETPLPGAYIVALELLEDERGFFARTFCAAEFAERSLNPIIAQCNRSYNRKQGTVRGLHYQLPPAAETKLMRCVRGAIYDVIVDMRPTSPTYLQHFGIELNDTNRLALYVPELFAHGYQALTDGAEVEYPTGAPYTSECERGLRYDDPGLNISWPLQVSAVSAKDLAWPTLESLGVLP